MAILVEDAVASRAPEDPRRPRLAEGTELLGEFQDSAYQTPKYLVKRADGQVMQLPRLLYRVAGSMDGRPAGQIASELSAELHEDVTAEQVLFLVDERLTPVGIVASEDPDETRTAPPPVKSDPLLALKYRVGLVPAAVSWRVAGVLRPLFARPVWVVAVGLFLAVHAWIVARGGLLDQTLAGVEQLTRVPTIFLAMFVVQAASATWHECGHVTACRYGGARPGDMGVGLYIIWPAFYSTVTDSYRLDRVGRLRTDLGGLYFDAVFMTGVGLAYVYTGQPWILIMLFGMLFEMAWQFLPSIRLDGYYILADLVGVPDLFSYLGPALKSLIPGRPNHPKIQELRPGARRVIVGWVAVSIPTLLTFLVLFLIALPHVLPVVWEAFQWHLNSLDASLRVRDVASTTLGLVDVLLLLLPWLGVLLVWGMIWGNFRQWAAARWGWAWAQPETWAGVRKAMAGFTAAALAAGLVWRAWVVAGTTPPAGTETRIAASALGALRLGWDAAPAVPLSDVVARDQLLAYAQLTGAFERHADVTTGARELAVVACAVLVLCLLCVRAMLRWQYRTVVLPLAAVAAMGPAVSTLSTFGPGVVGAAWAAVGGTLLVAAARRRGGQEAWRTSLVLITGAGLAALVIGVLTAPVLAVPLMVGAALVLRRPGDRPSRRIPWAPLVVGGSAATVMAVALLASLPGTPAVAPLSSAEVNLLVVLAGLVSLAGAMARGLGGMTAMTGSLVLLALVPLTAAGTTLPLLVCATAVLGAQVVAAWTRRPGEQTEEGWAQHRRRLVRAAVAAPVALVVLVGALFLPPRAPDLPHQALAQWMAGPGAHVPTVTAPLPVWAELVREGVPADRLVPAGTDSPAGADWEVVVGERSGGAREAVVFGSGDEALTVLGPG